MTYLMNNPTSYTASSSNYVIDISKPVKTKRDINIFLARHPYSPLFALFIAAPLAILAALFASVSAVILPLAWVLGLI